jgi:hypothetical protein
LALCAAVAGPPGHPLVRRGRPESQGVGELDLPDREQPDGYLQLAQALSRAGDQRLAIDTPTSPDLQRLSTAELRAERDRLRRQLDQAPATAAAS